MNNTFSISGLLRRPEAGALLGLVAVWIGIKGVYLLPHEA